MNKTSNPWTKLLLRQGAGTQASNPEQPQEEGKQDAKKQEKDYYLEKVKQHLDAWGGVKVQNQESTAGTAKVERTGINRWFDRR